MHGVNRRTQSKAKADDLPMAIPVSEGQGMESFQQQPGKAMTMTRQDNGMAGVPMSPSPIETRVASLNGFDIKQVFHGIEMLGWEKKNKYNIYENQGGAHILLAQETQADCCERQCCGPQRSCTIQFHAGTTKESPTFATFSKDFHCQNCCFMRPSAKVLDKNHTMIADIYDPFYLCAFNQRVKDGQGNLIYLITGSCCQLAVCLPCNDFHFDIKEAGSEKVVGQIVKKFNDCAELCGQVNHFSLTFPREIPVAHKLALLGAVFLLDFEYFEKTQ